MYGAFIRALSFALALFPALASAQSPIAGFPPGTFQSRSAIDAGTVGYQGPGDVATFIAFGSCSFAYTAAYAAGAGSACDLVDTATGGFACTLKFAVNGAADLISLSCTGGTLSVMTFCTVTHAAGCSITKVYDQTGNGHDWTNATLASMPLVKFSAIGSNPAIQCVGATPSKLTSASYTLSEPVSISAVVNRTSLNGGTSQFSFVHSVGQVGYTSAANTAFMAYGSSFTATASDASPHALQYVFNTASSSINVDGAATSGSVSGGGLGAATDVLCSTGTANAINGYIGEVGANNQSSYSAALRANVLTRWGI